MTVHQVREQFARLVIVIAGFALLSVPGILTKATQGNAPQGKPNIVFILATATSS